MVTGPLFKWFGSKWLSGKHLPQPTHDTVIEPFAGGAGYSLRHAHLKVIIAETDPHISLLWRWLVSAEATEAAIREIPIGVREGTDIRKLGLSLGQATLLKSWQRTNNVGDCWTISPWGNKPGQWTENARARVSAEVGAVKHWTVAPSANAAFASQKTATWFIDPPYQYNYGYRSNPIDYAALAKSARACRGQVIACEAICPKTGAVPDYLPFTFWQSRVTSRRKVTENHHSKELLWVRP